MSGSGEINNCYDLQSALSSPSIMPGNTVYLSGGGYSGDYVCNLAGTSSRPITIKPHNNERVVIDGSLTVNGAYTEWHDIEVMYSGWTKRQTEIAGSSPEDIVSKNILIGAPGCKFINCIIHDMFSPGFLVEANDAEFYGCLIYNCGWTGPDRGHGHGLYIHNSIGTKLIKNCVIFNNFGWGIHAYYSDSSRLNGLVFDGNICFSSGLPGDYLNPNMLIGAESGIAQSPDIKNNVTYGGSVGMRFYQSGAENGRLTDNYFSDGMSGEYTGFFESGNELNEIGDRHFIFDNDYKTGRSNIAIFNESQADSVMVDLSNIAWLIAGTVLTARNVNDYFGDIQTLVLDENKKITIDMRAENRTVVAPVSWPTPVTTFPTFGAFVVEKQ